MKFESYILLYFSYNCLTKKDYNSINFYLRSKFV
ncbi:hypothetical protein CJE1349 [Campylobacter jejuni RM1221]|nr:hypothetical protein CJE1349 [Campylobacter jejuni RM1221]